MLCCDEHCPSLCSKGVSDRNMLPWPPCIIVGEPIIDIESPSPLFTQKPEIPIVSEGGTRIQFEDVWNCHSSGCSLWGPQTDKNSSNLVLDSDCSSDTLATKEKLDLSEAEAPCWCCGQWFPSFYMFLPRKKSWSQARQGRKKRICNHHGNHVSLSEDRVLQSITWLIIMFPHS